MAGGVYRYFNDVIALERVGSGTADSDAGERDAWRWVVLEPTSLCYFDSQAGHAQQKRPKGAIPLCDCSTRSGAGSDFKVCTPSRTYDLRAAEPHEARAWLEAINAAVRAVPRGA